MSLQKALVIVNSGLESLRVVLETHPGAEEPPENIEVARQRFIEHVQNEASVRDQVDQICRGWIADGDWPEMDWATGTFVWDRLYEANLFGRWMCAYGFYAADRTEAEILEILLLAHWADLGITRLRTRLDGFGTSPGQAPGTPPRI